MRVENLLGQPVGVKKLSKSSSSFTACYKYWTNVLFERAMRLFVWTGLDESIPQKQIEMPLLLNGMAVMKEYEGKVTPFFGNYSGKPTVFFDTWESASIRSPLTSGVYKIGTEVSVIRNNALCNSLYHLIHRYAIVLGHMEVSLINTLINGRDSGGIPVASTETQRKSIEAYRDALCNGRVGSILDPAFSGVQFLSVDKNTTLSIKDLVEAMRNELDSYYNSIGVKTGYDKKGNMIEEEVSANDSMILLNIEDMLESRKRGADETNKLFGTSLSVDKAEVLKYNTNIGGEQNGNGTGDISQKDNKRESS